MKVTAMIFENFQSISMSRHPPLDETTDVFINILVKLNIDQKIHSQGRDTHYAQQTS